MVPALLALAAAGGTALVNAMVTDGWEGVRKKIGTLFGRGNPKQTQDTLDRLDRSHTELSQLSGADQDSARQKLAIAWQTRFEDLLAEHPDAAGELRQIVQEISARDIGTGATIRQNVQAYDHAQVNVQGSGIQHVTFGNDSGAS
jgi:predicted component of type VI protein secretion system